MTDWRGRAGELSWVLLPLRAFLGFVYLYAGISKIADRRFLDSSSPRSIYANLLAVRHSSPIGDLLGPVQHHATFALVTVGRLQADIVFGIGPVDTDEGSKFSVSLSIHDSPRSAKVNVGDVQCSHSAKAI